MPAEIYRAMVAHARFSLPEEGCGLLAADEDGRLRMAYCLSNADRSPTSYRLDPQEHFRALCHAEAYGWHLAGVFHSHPDGPTQPSGADVARAREPGWLYVVVSLADRSAPAVLGYWIRDGEVQEEPLFAPADEMREVQG